MATLSTTTSGAEIQLVLRTLRESTPIFDTRSGVLQLPSATPVQQRVQSAPATLEQRLAANGIGRLINLTA